MSLTVDQSFAREARDVLGGVRRALAELVGSVGADPTQPQEISRKYGLDKTLSWKITRVICEDDALEAVRLMPGRPGLRIFIDALERSGAPTDRAERVRQAVEEYETFIETHSGDRETFETMIGGVSKEVARRRGEALRKQAFTANSGIWGVRSRAQVNLHFCAPNAQNPDMLDLGVVCGLVDFSRLRPDARWAVSSIVSVEAGGVLREAFDIRPMHAEVPYGEAPVVPEFCSSPMPKLAAVKTQEQRTRFEFVEGPVGNTAAATCILGWVARASVPRYAQPNDDVGELMSHFNTPTEIAFVDMYVHRDLMRSMPPSMHLYSQMPGGPIYPKEGPAHGQLALPEDLLDLGSPPDMTAAPLPMLGSLVEFGITRMGHGLRDFHGYRLRLRYPPIPTLSVFRFKLEPKA